MALNYGYTAPNNTKLDELNLKVTNNKEKITALTNAEVPIKYIFYYESVSLQYRTPYKLNPGYPAPIIYARGTNDRSKITLLHHHFDLDGTISNLKVRYTLVCYLNDNTSEEVDLKDIDLSSLKVTTLYNYFILNETFVLKDHVTRYQDIELMYIKFKKLSGATNGNESVLTLLSYTTL